MIDSVEHWYIMLYTYVENYSKSVEYRESN